jgi:hypothetical protein
VAWIGRFRQLVCLGVLGDKDAHLDHGTQPKTYAGTGTITPQCSLFNQACAVFALSAKLKSEQTFRVYY